MKKLKKEWKMKEQKKKEDVGDKPKPLTYSLERRVNKKHRLHNALYLIEDLNFETNSSTKKDQGNPHT